MLEDTDPEVKLDPWEELNKAVKLLSEVLNFLSTIYNHTFRDLENSQEVDTKEELVKYMYLLLYVSPYNAGCQREPNNKTYNFFGPDDMHDFSENAKEMMNTGVHGCLRLTKPDFAAWWQWLALIAEEK